MYDAHEHEDNYDDSSGSKLVYRSFASYGFGAAARQCKNSRKVQFSRKVSDMNTYSYVLFVPSEPILTAGATPIETAPNCFKPVDTSSLSADTGNDKIHYKDFSCDSRESHTNHTSRVKVVHGGELLEVLRERQDVCCVPKRSAGKRSA